MRRSSVSLMASLKYCTHCTCGGNHFLSLLWWLHKVCGRTCSPFLKWSMLTGCTFPFFDLSIFFPTLSFNFSIVSVFDEGRSRWRLGYSGAFWSQGMLGVRAFGAALRAVKGNRLNHAVKQVFTGLHYNVIFSPPLSLSILLPSESLDFFRLMIFDQWEVGGW